MKLNDKKPMRFKKINSYILASMLMVAAGIGISQAQISKKLGSENGWKNIEQKESGATLCGLVTTGLPFTFGLYNLHGQGPVKSSIRLSDPSWGMGADTSPEITLQIGEYQNIIHFTPNHLTEMRANISADEMRKILTTLSNSYSSSASFAFAGLEPNSFSIKGAKNLLPSFEKCGGN